MGTLLFVVAALTAGPARAAAPTSSCVSCHEAEKDAPTLAHSFEEWRTSPHARAGIECSVCHGGDPTRTEKAAAHATMRPSSDPLSGVYYTTVPLTCGRCHGEELAAFKTSRHWEEMSKRGRGPNCVTCHGAMADAVIAPRDMELTCTLCHRLPTRAYDARVAVADAEAALKEYESAVARTRGDPTAALARVTELRRRLRSVRVASHDFRVEKTLAAAVEVERDAVAARAALAVKPRRP